MCKIVTLAVLGLCCDWFVSAALSAEPHPIPKNLGLTIDLYLSSDASYRNGDLITESQLAEFQTYLHRTQGQSLATQQKWAKKALADRESIAHMFHNGGAAVIRAAAEKAGGYGELDRLGATPRGREVIKNAIKEKSPEQILAALANRLKKQVSESTGKPKDKPITTKNPRIYTAEDYVTAVKQASQALSGKKDSQSADESRPSKPEKQVSEGEK